jgi:hypothetical protein
MDFEVRQYECGYKGQEAPQNLGILAFFSDAWTAVVDSPTLEDYTDNLKKKKKFLTELEVIEPKKKSRM